MQSVHIIWATEKMRASDLAPAPSVDESQLIEPERPVLRIELLVRMKLVANRLHDRTHIRDMIHVGLIDEAMVGQFSGELAERLKNVFDEYRREDLHRPG
jgi:hypothetical protein